jgi:small-conductance mechanosensitive channel
MLELAKAATFFACIVSLYWVLLSAFFVPGLHWQDRLFLSIAKLALAAAVCLLSALVFRLPIRSNPDANRPITSTLPMQLFFWAAPLLLLLFLASWYLVCGAPSFTSHYPSCS